MAERIENLDRWPALVLVQTRPTAETDTLMVELDSIAHQLQAARHAQGVRVGFRSGWWRGFTVGVVLATVAACGAVVVWGWGW